MSDEEKQPGLHKVGPNPWDYEFNPAKGMKIASVGLDGEIHHGIITDFDENEATGELTLTVDPSCLPNPHTER